MRKHEGASGFGKGADERRGDPLQDMATGSSDPEDRPRIRIAQLLNDELLYEVLDAENDTPFSTSDLVKILRAEDGPWTGAMTSSEFDEWLRANGIDIDC